MLYKGIQMTGKVGEHSSKAIYAFLLRYEDWDPEQGSGLRKVTQKEIGARIQMT